MERESPRPRVLWATAAAFLFPGAVFTVLTPLLAPDIWNPGHLKIGLANFAVMTVGMSLIGAIFGSPVIVGALLIWRLLYRQRRVSYWAFASVGLVSGSAFGLLFSWIAQFETWGYLGTLSMSGMLTGSVVWVIAYGRYGRSEGLAP